MSNVFGVPVFVHSTPNSACVGAAYRALHGWKSIDHFVSFDDVVEHGPQFSKATDPDAGWLVSSWSDAAGAHKVYQGMLGRYQKLEKQILDEQ